MLVDELVRIRNIGPEPHRDPSQPDELDVVFADDLNAFKEYSANTPDETLH